MKITQSIIIASLLSSATFAAPISSKSGFSGFIAGGVTALSYKSNMIAGTVFDDEMTDKRIDSLNNKPDSKSTAQPSFDFNLKYTFADIQTEIFMGKEVEDVLSFDNTTNIGARKHFNGIGTIGVALLVQSIPTKVWEDPYRTLTNRRSKDMTSGGLSLKWEGIVGSNFDVELRARAYDIDGGDKSGLSPTYGTINPLNFNSLILNDQLDREGSMSQLILSYRWEIDKKQSLKTSLNVSDYDLDGDAMQHSKVGVKLDYLYAGQTWDFIAVTNISQSDYENVNPLFMDKADALSYGASLTTMYKNPFNISEDLSLTATVAGYKKDSDIDFYDESMALVNVGLLYRF
jgi:hypothetical protein